MDYQKIQLRTLRRIAFISGTILAIFFLMAFVPKIVSDLRDAAPELPSGRHWEGQVMTAMFAIFMLGYAVGWWRPFWGGLLIILAALSVSAPFLLRGNHGALIFGVPQFVIGLLYVLLSRVERRRGA